MNWNHGEEILVLKQCLNFDNLKEVRAIMKALKKKTDNQPPNSRGRRRRGGFRSSPRVHSPDISTYLPPWAAGLESAWQ